MFSPVPTFWQLEPIKNPALESTSNMSDANKDEAKADTGPTLHDEISTEGLPQVLDGAIDPTYERKAQTLNAAIQQIGMGSYQWQLFVVVGGFGWASDNLWPVVTSLILPAITSEFSPSKPPLLSLSQNIGLLAGAIFWGFGCTLYYPCIYPLQC